MRKKTGAWRNDTTDWSNSGFNKKFRRNRRAIKVVGGAIFVIALVNICIHVYLFSSQFVN